MNDSIKVVLGAIGATALVFIVLGQLGVELPVWGSILAGGTVGAVFGIVNYRAERKNRRS